MGSFFNKAYTITQFNPFAIARKCPNSYFIITPNWHNVHINMIQINKLCYYIKDIGVLFSGDTLFCGSVGRTDFPGGSMSAIVRSIKDKIMVLPDDTKVYPGHGEGTSVGYERVNNPFLV